MLAWMTNCNTSWLLYSKNPKSSAAHLRISRGTPECRGTQFKNHWSKLFQYFETSYCNIFCVLFYQSAVYHTDRMKLFVQTMFYQTLLEIPQSSLVLEKKGNWNFSVKINGKMDIKIIGKMRNRYLKKSERKSG